MEPVASFQGLASGIRFRDLVDQIIAAESRPVVLLEQKKVELDRGATAWTDFEFLNGEIFYTLPPAKDATAPQRLGAASPVAWFRQQRALTMITDSDSALEEQTVGGARHALAG